MFVTEKWETNTAQDISEEGIQVICHEFNKEFVAPEKRALQQIRANAEGRKIESGRSKRSSAETKTGSSGGARCRVHVACGKGGMLNFYVISEIVIGNEWGESSG